jgi:hypothetical protein
MANNNFDVLNSNRLHPECPLELIKFTAINPDGSTSIVLKIRSKEQKLTFKDALYLTDYSLTFTIPKYIYDNDDNFYMIQKPNPTNIKIIDMSGNQIPINIIESTCVYYLNIFIMDDFFCYNDLILTFTKFNLVLQKTCKTDEIVCDVPVSHQWQWIASVVCK